MVKTPHVNLLYYSQISTLFISLTHSIHPAATKVFPAHTTISLQSLLYVRIPQECRGLCLVSACVHTVRVCPGCLTLTILRDEAFPPME